ncbi:ComF family protein [Saccharothrix syringae]|uniref:ComF family protein n=1 Tax=Saccharothrix syringae TaxID=103733 RepID=A0A5Q0HET3_SACSY|nr:ComF family protein [Saccharothrix syringae]
MFALAPYAGAARELVLAFKERGRRDLAAVFGALIAAALPRLPGLHPLRPHPPGSDPPAPHSLLPHSRTLVPGAPSPDVPPPVGPPLLGLPPLVPPPLVPPVADGPIGAWLVPAPSRSSAARARGGSHVLRMARASGFPVAPALAFAKGVRDSIGLDAGSRRLNLAGRVRIVPGGLPPPGTPVVLLDDVVTTGSTARACISVLKSGGFRVSGVLALTTARRTHPVE